MIAIVAMASNRIIGKDGKIPWRCKEDLQWFKEFALHKTIVVGRKTFEGLPPLKDRNIVVLSRSVGKSNNPNVRFITDINDVPAEAIIAGGAEIYAELLPYCKQLFVSEIKGEYEGDTYMPPFEHFFSNKSVIEKENFRLINYTK